MPKLDFSTLTDRNDIITYIPAQLKEYKKSWRIEYFCLDPESRKLSRQQIRVDAIRKRYTTKREARVYLASVCANINAKLSGGWNPLLHSEDSRVYTPILHVLDMFITEKRMELRQNSMRSYESWVSLFKTWLDSKYMHNVITGRINKMIIVQYMDYIYMERKVKAVTYNNHIKIGRAVFNWMKEKGYINDNPFEQVKAKKISKKKRILIDEITRTRIKDYLVERNNVEFLIVLELVYNSLIRPHEITLIQLKHINLKDHYIFIPSEVAKNHKDRYATISASLINKLSDLDISKYPGNYYLFGSNLKISKDGCKRMRLTKEWTKLRRALRLPDEMQLYSLRDTGITEMLKSGIDNLTVMQHADHHDLAMTTRYANHADVNLVSKIYENAPKF